MKRFAPMPAVPVLLILAGLLIAFTARAYSFTASDFGTKVEDMYRDYAAQMPQGNRVYVCTRDCMGDPKWYRYSASDLAVLKEIMQSNSAQRERENLARSVQWIVTGKL